MTDNVELSQKISQDLEFSGAINKAVSQPLNKNFGLLLAMLQQDVLDRKLIEKEPQKETYKSDIEALNHYRPHALATTEDHWRQQNTLNSYVNDNDFPNARLWECLFPPPLSLHNDRYRVGDEVKHNAPYDTQLKLDLMINHPAETDPTKLYDILNTLNSV